MGLTALLVIAGTAPASAADAVDQDLHVDRLIENAPKGATVVAEDDGSTTRTPDGGSVTLPHEGGEVVSFHGADGSAAALSAPATAAVTTQVLSEGSARAIVAIDNLSQPTSYEFDLDLPPGVVPELQLDGSVEFVLAEDGSAPATTGGPQIEFDLGGLAAPWAFDANGKPVDTYYVLEGDRVIQHVEVDETTAFPVITDPEMEWKGYYATLTYSASETLGMRDQGVIIAGMLAAAAGMAAFGPPGAAIGAGMATIGAASTGIIAATASNAVSDGRCLSVDVPSMIPSIVDC